MKCNIGAHISAQSSDASSSIRFDDIPGKRGEGIGFGGVGVDIDHARELNRLIRVRLIRLTVKFQRREVGRDEEKDTSSLGLFPID